MAAIVFWLAGVACVTVGAFLVSAPVGFVTLGVGLLVTSRLLTVRVR